MTREQVERVERLVQMKVDRLERAYDPENDTIPGAPRVTYADIQLVEAVKELLWAAQKQQEQIDKLERRLQNEVELNADW